MEVVRPHNHLKESSGRSESIADPKTTFRIDDSLVERIRSLLASQNGDISSKSTRSPFSPSLPAEKDTILRRSVGTFSFDHGQTTTASPRADPEGVGHANGQSERPHSGDADSDDRISNSFPDADDLSGRHGAPKRCMAVSSRELDALAVRRAGMDGTQSRESLAQTLSGREPTSAQRALRQNLTTPNRDALLRQTRSAKVTKHEKQGERRSSIPHVPGSFFSERDFLQDDVSKTSSDDASYRMARQSSSLDTVSSTISPTEVQQEQIDTDVDPQPLAGPSSSGPDTHSIKSSSSARWSQHHTLFKPSATIPERPLPVPAVLTSNPAKKYVPSGASATSFHPRGFTSRPLSSVAQGPAGAPGVLDAAESDGRKASTPAAQSTDLSSQKERDHPVTVNRGRNVPLKHQTTEVHPLEQSSDALFEISRKPITSPQRNTADDSGSNNNGVKDGLTFKSGRLTRTPSMQSSSESSSHSSSGQSVHLREPSNLKVPSTDRMQMASPRYLTYGHSIQESSGDAETKEVQRQLQATVANENFSATGLGDRSEKSNVMAMENYTKAIGDLETLLDQALVLARSATEPSSIAASPDAVRGAPSLDSVKTARRAGNDGQQSESYSQDQYFDMHSGPIANGPRHIVLPESQGTPQHRASKQSYDPRERTPYPSISVPRSSQHMERENTSQQRRNTQSSQRPNLHISPKGTPPVTSDQYQQNPLTLIDPQPISDSEKLSNTTTPPGFYGPHHGIDWATRQGKQGVEGVTGSVPPNVTGNHGELYVVSTKRNDDHIAPPGTFHDVPLGPQRPRRSAPSRPEAPRPIQISPSHPHPNVDLDTLSPGALSSFSEDDDIFELSPVAMGQPEGAPFKDLQPTESMRRTESSSSRKFFSLKHRRHVSLRGSNRVRLGRSSRRQPIARDWSVGRKRLVAAVACLNTALLGLIVGIYAGEVPAIQYQIFDLHHYTILGNVVLYIGVAIPTLLFWSLPLLHGRKVYNLAAIALSIPLQLPQAIAVTSPRSPDTPVYRLALLLSRSALGLVLGFANVNFQTTLLDLFGASLQSTNPHQEIVDVYDVRRHGGGMGIWLGVWSWCYVGSIGVGFLFGALIINTMNPSWGFWLVVLLTAIMLLLNVLVPEVRRSAHRRSMAVVRSGTDTSMRVARGEVTMHIHQTGPKWWWEEVRASLSLQQRMLKQPGFAILALYHGWLYGQVVLVIVLLGALTSKYYRFRPPLVGASVSAVPIGALLAVPFQKASWFSRSRKERPRTDSMTFQKRVTWTSHLVRRTIFMVVLPFAGLAYTLSSRGPPTHPMVPIMFAGFIGFLSNLAVAECNGLIMETYDTSDLQPGMTGQRPRASQANHPDPRRTNYSCFPRVSAAFAISQTFGFCIAAAGTGVGGRVERRLGAQASTGVVAGILLVLTLMLLGALWRWKEVQVIPSVLTSVTGPSGGGGEVWRPIIIGHPSGKVRRMSLLELGSQSRWTEIRRRNRLLEA
ncbi:MAG: hypothetical protein M1833_003613 [Piccolia ochrophora]|nr:MAG: hypothetical protein M1833_003613 [Piccolia ochrophora]